MSTLIKYQTELSRLSKFLAAAREELGDRPSVQQVQTFLAVCASPEGITQSDLMARTKIGKTSMSKNVADLTEVTALRQPGPGLLEQQIDPANRIYRIVKLTNKGERAAMRIITKTFGTKT